jgi:hypothetical protein
VGAAEAGKGAMKFGVAAATSGASTGGSTGGSGTTPPVTPPPGTGSAPVSTTIASSSYTINAGQAVTLTVNVMGNGATPTGTIAFKDNGTTIAACSASSLFLGRATCTTTALVAGSHAMTGVYSGDSAYGTGVAGPLTETVNASTAIAATMVSSASPATFGQPVTLTVRVTGGSSPTGTVAFKNGTTVIPGCASAPLSGGSARCTTSTFARGTRILRGTYSGDSHNRPLVTSPIEIVVK